MQSDIPKTLQSLRSSAGLSQEALARLLGVSFVSINRWERGASAPSPDQAARIRHLKHQLETGGTFPTPESKSGVFASHGARHRTAVLPLFEEPIEMELASHPGSPILDRLIVDGVFSPKGEAAIADVLARHTEPASTASQPPKGGVSAGKNSYTYDAHTYHTKVPPQGIAEILRHYLPHRGLVLDPFGGSGMTGVAALATGNDCVINELSPAACFISNRFLTQLDPDFFHAAVSAVLKETREIRRRLYTTQCRECGKDTEILYTVWSYKVNCGSCNSEFQLWDACRRYGRRVRDHKILKEFPCPNCRKRLIKSRLVRTVAEPVQLGYVCCGSRQQEVVHPLTPEDLRRIEALNVAPALVAGFYPTMPLADGVNLSQPKRHGLTHIDRLYTPRNLAALSHIWETIHRFSDDEQAAHLAFTFTSLYQRVTRLSEFRFWGGSGNTARFNVPFIFNESNVFITFERKARTIQDHLSTTAKHFHASAVVVNGSATNLRCLPDESVDLIFTDPPFGANINYSEMNVLWESWLGRFTDATHEAVINRFQGKDVDAYRRLMTESVAECYRVLRRNHWLILVFMNTSARVWEALRSAIFDAGFEIKQADSFDKQHGTFKQFVSDNTAGEDLVIHCLKKSSNKTQHRKAAKESISAADSVLSFLRTIHVASRMRVFLHVGRKDEVDFRALYTEWMAHAVKDGVPLIDFADFRVLTLKAIENND